MLGIVYSTFRVGIIINKIYPYNITYTLVTRLQE